MTFSHIVIFPMRKAFFAKRFFPMRKVFAKAIYIVFCEKLSAKSRLGRDYRRKGATSAPLTT